MPDVFISHVAADRERAGELAAHLELKGWKVWWGRPSDPDEPLHEEAMRQLAAARAVIVLWSRASVSSDIVKTEAGRAKAAGKLIPVRDDSVTYADLPHPFGEMHTENLSRPELIRAAVTAQLAEPHGRPAPWRVANSLLKYQVLTWVGILGGTMTLFTNLQGVLNLAMWSQWIVRNWEYWSTAFWQGLAAIMGLKLQPYWSGLLTFIVFGATIAVGQRLARHAKAEANGAHHKPALELIGTRRGMLVLALLVLAPVLYTAAFYSIPPPSSVVLQMLFSLLVALPLGAPVAAAVYKSKAPVQIMGVLILTTLFYFIIAYPAADYLYARHLGDRPAYEEVFVGLMAASANVVTVGMLAIAPAEALLTRLSFLACGLLTLVLLNTLSRYAENIETLLKPPGS